MPARDFRTGSTRSRAVPGADRGRDALPARPNRPRVGATRDPRRPTDSATATAPSPLPASVADGLVIGPVPAAARVCGVLLLLVGLVGSIAPFPTYLVVGGRPLTVASGVGTALVAVLVPVVDLVVGAVLARGRIPRLGLAYAAVSGALAVGQLLIQLYEGIRSTARPAEEVIVGQRVLTSTVDVRSGWVLGVVALVLAVLAGLVAASAWGRTVMEDGGSLDRARPSLAGVAALLGVATVLCLALPAADMPDRVVTDPSTGMQTVVTQEGGPQALLERPGLALLGGLLLAGAIVLCAVVAPSLRPRLAAVGGLLAIAVTVLDAALQGLRDAVVSPQLTWSVPGAGLLLAGIGFAGLTVLAWRLRRGALRAPGS